MRFLLILLTVLALAIAGYFWLNRNGDGVERGFLFQPAQLTASQIMESAARIHQKINNLYGLDYQFEQINLYAPSFDGQLALLDKKDPHNFVPVAIGEKNKKGHWALLPFYRNTEGAQEEAPLDLFLIFAPVNEKICREIFKIQNSQMMLPPTLSSEYPEDLLTLWRDYTYSWVHDFAESPPPHWPALSPTKISFDHYDQCLLYEGDLYYARLLAPGFKVN